MHTLDVRDLRTRFKTEHGTLTAVDGVSFTVDAGEIVGVVGESGSGKSVTAESVMRLLDEKRTSYDGEVLLDGTNLLTLSAKQMRPIRGGRIAMIFQDPMTSLNPVFTIGNQLLEAILLHRTLSKSEARTIAEEALSATGISNPAAFMRRYPHELSGGMCQRVVIAMALASRPNVLVADEPTTALDVTTQAQILQLIAELRDEFSMATLLITHDMGVVAEVCTRVVVMYLGQVVERGTVDEIFSNPRHPYTRGLLASIPSLTGDRSKPLHVIEGKVPSLREIPTGCRFAGRCPFVQDACRSATPTLDELGPTIAVRCRRRDELPAWNAGKGAEND